MAKPNRPFGRVVQELRENARITQKELAERANVSYSTVQKAEAAEDQILKWDTLEKLAQGLGKTSEEVIEIWQDGATLNVHLPAKLWRFAAREARASGQASVENWLFRLLSDLMAEQSKMRIAAKETPASTGKRTPARSC